jgi:hypothetical protein
MIPAGKTLARYFFDLSTSQMSKIAIPAFAGMAPFNEFCNYLINVSIEPF